MHRFFWFTALFFFFNTSFTAYAQGPNYRYHFCTNTANFTLNSTYSTNLRTLLSSLSSPNASFLAGFQNATAGKSPDMVTGLFLCQGDLSSKACRDCVVFAVTDSRSRCPVQKGATIWYDGCMLRYSHSNILSTLSLSPTKLYWNVMNITDYQVKRFNEVLFSMMNQTVKEATEDSRRFAVKKANVTAFQTLYGLVQCTPDITKQDCKSCLQLSVSQLPRLNIGGTSLLPSCFSRFELYSFYNESAVETPPPPSPPLPLPSTPPPPSGQENSIFLPYFLVSRAVNFPFILSKFGNFARISQNTGKHRNSFVIIAAVGAPVIASVLLLVAIYCFLGKRAKKNYEETHADDGSVITTAESLQFDFKTVEYATNNFSEGNKLGVGGFGEVYKGTLPNGTEIAVKRLSKTSSQGKQEFKNEVVLVAKLHHRNLVRLLGFCVEGEEKILIYEFVPNKSLDSILFDPTKQGQLDWMRRTMIIDGIVRGIHYLHYDSRLTIIHRDLKASNVLLDRDMKPKIADFGMARIFGMDQIEAVTNRVVGTFGYMSPEYAMYGQISMKSDVYSFGVLVLEIISGKKNSSFYQSEGANNLVTYAWTLWRNGSPLELVDPTIRRNFPRNEVTRYIHIALLCVQEDHTDRPTMSTIVMMFSSVTMTLPVPTHPEDALETARNWTQSTNTTTCSVDDSSITILHPR